MNQKRIQHIERGRFGNHLIDVSESVFHSELRDLVFNADALGINFENTHWDKQTSIHLLKGPDYDKWPATFSYDLDYKQKDELGDARTNWEKNRHFQWALLAKAYYVSGDDDFFLRLEKEVADWCRQNSFLHGISWTSAMEFAIRSINWMYACAFLSKVRNAERRDRVVLLCNRLQTGVINIVEYLTKHYSRYSSANNHLLVEAAAIGLAGHSFGYEPWQEIASQILTEELTKQNYNDGVNKELSLHYQTFGMEAYLLLAHVSGETRWNEMLCKEAEFVAHSVWKEQTVLEFGDDDEGKILDLQGGEWHQWQWVLQFVSLVTGTRYADFETVCENAYWLFSEQEIEAVKSKKLYDASGSRVFAEGGNSFFRDKENRVLIGIDHAALGFGPIAAHGHADALSFQMLIDGIPVFTDPGTFVYHCRINDRNNFRKTIHHNTLCLIDENGQYKDQSQMLGAFLWGSRAECTLTDYRLTDDVDTLAACHNGYKPNIHRRCFDWNKTNRVLIIEDTLSLTAPYVVSFMLGVEVGIEAVEKNRVLLSVPTGEVEMRFQNHDNVVLENAEISMEYGVKIPTKAIRIYAHDVKILTQIEVKLKK